MVNRHALLIVALGALAVAACDKVDNEAKREPAQTVTNTNATANANPIVAAANASDVKQLADQTRLSPSPVRVLSEATVRKAPLAMDAVTVLRSGESVTEVAKAHDYYLVMFVEPSTSKTLAGWVHQDALVSYAGQPMPPTPVFTCKEGEVHARTNHEFCTSLCSVDADCRKVQGFCDGNGKILSAAGTLIDGRYCVTPNP